MATISIASNMYPAAIAVAKVFDIAELREMILEQTSFRDLLRAQRINKTFHATIKRSIRLQRRMAWLQIENVKTMHTPLSFRLQFKAQDGYGPFSMPWSPIYAEDDQDALLSFTFDFESSRPFTQGFTIMPTSSGSWRDIRVSNRDHPIEMVSTLAPTFTPAAGATLREVYDELCRQQEVEWARVLKNRERRLREAASTRR